jgi:hypothetical protein
MEIKGKVVKIYDLKQISDSFKTQSFVVEYIDNPEKPEYVEFLKMEMVQDNCDKLNAVSEGDVVNVEFNLKGRRYEKGGDVNYFNSIQAWKLSVLQSAAPVPADIPAPIPEQVDPIGDLPF